MLRSIVHFIRSSYGFSSITGIPTVIYENNATCIAQIKGVHQKGSSQAYFTFFYTHELEKCEEIDVRKKRSNKNFANMLTKAL